MPWVSHRQLMTDARNREYAIGAFNMHNEETTEALVLAAEQANAPVVLQVGRAIVPHVGLKRGFEMTKRTQEIRDVTGIPLVLHGASGIPENEVHAAKAAGVHKFNADTDLRHVFRQGMLDVWSKGDRQLEDAMAECRKRMIASAIEKMKLYGCTGKAKAT